jgi:hypothetical protein
MLSHGNGPVGEVETEHEILLIYRAHPVLSVYKISVADMLCKGAKNIAQIRNVQFKFVPLHTHLTAHNIRKASSMVEYCAIAMHTTVMHVCGCMNLNCTFQI